MGVVPHDDSVVPLFLHQLIHDGDCSNEAATRRAVIGQQCVATSGKDGQKFNIYINKIILE